MNMKVSMKSIFSIFLTCCTALTFAATDSFFEKAEKKVLASTIKEPIFEEDEGRILACEECDEEIDEYVRPEPEGYLSQNPGQANYVSWRRYKANFDVEKLFVRFPQQPAISRTAVKLTAYAYDNAALYSLTGFFPPIRIIDPIAYFDRVIFDLDQDPFRLIEANVVQTADGVWCLNYVLHDYVQNLITKAQLIITPFNAYTLACTKPNGMRDYFDYFLEHFSILLGE